MHGGLSYLQDIVVLLLAAVASNFTFKRIGVSSVLGYFLSGALIGTHGFSIVSSSEIIENVAQFGVVFLLFLIGLELTLQRLISMRLYVFGFGTLQLIITSCAIWTITKYIGLSSNISVLIGMSLAMSSTVIVVQFLKERGLQVSKIGRVSISVLLLQDFAVVPMIIFVQLLSDLSTKESKSEFMVIIGLALLKAFVTLIAIFLIGRLIVKPLLDMIMNVQSDEVFIPSMLLIVLGTAFATESFGLSMALGAFIAGLLVAETDYHKEVERAVLPFKDLLLGLFFMTVGMSVNYKTLLNNFYIILGSAIALLALKTLILYLLCRLFRLRRRHALQVAIVLSQAGEFSFVIFKLASKKGVIPDLYAEILMIVTTITMTVTPILSQCFELLEGKGSEDISSSHFANEEIGVLNDHVILIGFGRSGESVAKALTEESQQYVALEIDKDLVFRKKSEGFPVYFGNPTKIEILTALGAERASSIVITISNEISIKKIIHLVCENFPELTILTRAEDSKIGAVYHSLGAHLVIPERQETGVSLGVSALTVSGVSLSMSKLIAERLRKECRSGEL